MENNPKQHVEYYAELRAFLEGSNESEVTRGHLRKILEKRLQGVLKDYDFSWLELHITKILCIRLLQYRNIYIVVIIS